jgi:hypothetical protein
MASGKPVADEEDYLWMTALIARAIRCRKPPADHNLPGPGLRPGSSGMLQDPIEPMSAIGATQASGVVCCDSLREPQVT